MKLLFNAKWLLMLILMFALTTVSADAQRRRGYSHRTSVNRHARKGQCSRCKGTGKVKCTKCRGRGIIEEIVDGPPFSFYYGCRKCGGRGEEAGAGQGAAERSTLRRGSGKMKCPSCHGSGR